MIAILFLLALSIKTISIKINLKCERLEMIYEVLFIEDDIYYLKVYSDNSCSGVNMRMNKEEFKSFVINKKER